MIEGRLHTLKRKAILLPANEKLGFPDHDISRLTSVVYQGLSLGSLLHFVSFLHSYLALRIQVQPA
jgi:hypothetical protein